MAETADLSRKKRVRAAHRASVTRMVDQVQEMLSSEEGLNVAKLKQKRRALQTKTELLNKLDEEIVEMVPEDGLEEEVEQADIVRERIELAIIDLDSALDGIPAQPRRRAPTHSESDERERSDERHEPPADPPIHDDGLHSPHTDSSHRTDHPSREATPSGLPIDPGAGELMHSPRVKLPKLSLKRFNGDLTKWMTFWDTFESAVHNNPTLTSIDKFNYLNSLLESAAAEAIAGLTLTSANYEEAIATLRRRFGNKQLIVNRHMDLLLNLEGVTSQHNLKGLRQLYDIVESNVRGLRSLGVPSSSYGGLLSSILISKLPPELRLIVSRELSEGEWDFESMMKIIEREVEARERSAGASITQPKKPLGRTPPTALSLMASAPAQVTCVYCDHPHSSNFCQTVTDPEERKRLLRTSGRCFVCLRRHHISRNCRSSARCSKCRGRHHTSICSNSHTRPVTGTSLSNLAARSPPTVAAGAVQVPVTSSMCVNSPTPILLQTAKAIVYDASQPESTSSLEVRAILDLGSQRSYVTVRVQEALNMRKVRSESMIIKTFGSERENRRICDIVELGIVTKNGEPLTLSAVVVPHICDPVRMQPISSFKNAYEHLSGLELADLGSVTGELEIDVLIGSDHYWRLVTGRVSRGVSGPTAVETRLGWVLSGPVEEALPETTAINFIATHTTHTLRVDTFTEQESLDAGLRRFWELESLGILKNELSVYEKFTQQISLKQGRYEVHLPWKESHPPLPDNYELCRKRLDGLLRRLRQSPERLLQYDAVIRDQLRQGVVEVVADPTQYVEGQVHYLPHHAVIRQDKQTTKLRVVYDASARSNGPSLNDCLYTGPNFGQSILDILLRFRLHNVALVGDVEKAFLMVSVAECDRDVLRFLWIEDAMAVPSEIVVMRFTRVVFGVSSSPFLLNATIDNHMGKFKSIDQPFVKKFRRSIYVDDLTAGSHDVESAFEFYLKSKLRLAEASFNLRKFDTNSPELRRKISDNEQMLHREIDQESPGKTQVPSCDQCLKSAERQVLGVTWNVINDQLVFDISDICQLMKETSATKRNAVSLATRFFDPLGVISPITVRFKLLFQQMCEIKTDWDDPLTGELLTEWESLASDLQRSKPILLPRCYTGVESAPIKSYSLQGFCDASQRAYAAIVYLRVESEAGIYTQFLCSKTRVAPVKKLTIPRLELLSALLLARLVNTTRTALEHEINLGDSICYTDSQVALCWILGMEKEWKQFVQNRVLEIRELVPAASWRHCRGSQNPADIPSRGVSPSELQEKMELWLHGPTVLLSSEGAMGVTDMAALPEECLTEMKRGDRQKLTVTLLNSNVINTIVPCEDYSSLGHLLRLTAYVLKFIELIRKSKDSNSDQSSSTGCILTTEDVSAALVYWLKVSQSALPQTRKFQLWSQQFGLFKDSTGIWRCGGRLSNSAVPPAAKHPIFLNKDHYLTNLIVNECHERVMHGGVKATFTELRSRYWLVRGRQLVKKILHKCVVCRRFQARPYCPPPAPPLPSFRVNEARPFSYTGVDFAGPLYVRDTIASASRKVWICLYTCCVTRAVHLDVVPDMTSQAFIRSFKRFTSRRGFPVKIISDNAKTFKSAARTLAAVLRDPEVKYFFADINMKWSFNLEKAPWWGGVFERMIQSAKRCLRKTIGNARLTYDELITSVTEVEMILNSRPLSYVSSEDIEEPLTPSHLLVGYRVLSLPDPTTSADDEGLDNPATHGDLTRRMKHLKKTVDDFWKRWRTEYLLGLREAHRHLQTPKGGTNDAVVGDIVIVHDDKHPRGLWKLGRIEKLLPGADGNVRGAFIRVRSKGRSSILKRPLQRLYPLEVRAAENTSSPSPMSDDAPQPDTFSSPQRASDSAESSQQENLRPRRQAFLRAQDNIKTWVNDMNVC